MSSNQPTEATPDEIRQVAAAALKGGLIVTDTGHRTFITQSSAERMADAVIDKFADAGFVVTKATRG